jgi:thymidine phosphorylase
VAVDTQPENTVYLSRQCTLYRAEEFTTLKKVVVKNGKHSILATLVITDDPAIVSNNELGIADPAYRRLSIVEDSKVTIAPARPPNSLEAVRRKIHGLEMSEGELRDVIRDIADYRYSPVEIAAFLISSASFMTTAEILALTKAMQSVGANLSWDFPIVVDKHCIGGIPGNRTSLIIAPIVAAHGLHMPKTSSRAITSPAGTADTMEVLARVDLSIEEMQQVVAARKACLVWGGHVNLSPADDVLISVERPLQIDTREQMVASILSKKLAAGSTHLVVDIPVGPSAKIRSMEDAIRLRKLFEYVADNVGLVINIVITDGSQPVGRGIGPVLEARDVMQVLRNEPEAPNDLKERALLLAGKVLEFDPDLRGGAGRVRAEELLASGMALSAMESIIESQGRASDFFCPGEIVHDVKADRSGIVSSLDCYRLARIARQSGAPMDKGAGIDLFHKKGEYVAEGDVLYRVHSCFQSDFDFAVQMTKEDCGIHINEVQR